MAYEEAVQAVNINAGADLSAAAKLYTPVKVDSTGRVVSTSVLGEAADGILQNLPKLNDPAKVAIGGVTKAKAGGTIAAGAKVTTSAAGQVVAAAAGNKIIGTALTAAVVNDVIPVLLAPPGTAAF
ncbi:head fiber protein [Arthrobacter phage Ottawa]|nr:head fiber protein [Arthrobacter phage Kharcho]WIC89331.1 head fiber protein [Arthrobacter phage Ottawa]